jgi:HK97 family phage prohead protease
MLKTWFERLRKQPAKEVRATPLADVETRVVPLRSAEMRVSVEPDGTKKIRGYAAVFNAYSEDLGGFREIMLPGSFTNVLSRNADVRALVNHDPNLILGRSTSGTLELMQDDMGLGYVITPPATPLADHYVSAIERGDMSGCSFAFRVSKDKWTPGNADDNTPPTRTISEVSDLLDVGPVTYPAYPDTTVAMRSLANSTPVEAAETTASTQCSRNTVFRMRARLRLLEASLSDERNCS